MESKNLRKSDRIGQKNLRHLRNLRDPFKFQAAQAAKKSVFIRELKIGGRRESQICGTPDVLKTRNPLAISDISLIFAPCFNLMVKL